MTAPVSVTMLPSDAEKAAAAARKARHENDALRALWHGRGIGWASDITGLPARFVARVAAQSGIAEKETQDRDWSGPSAWETRVLMPVRVIRRDDLTEEAAAA